MAVKHVGGVLRALARRKSVYACWQVQDNECIEAP